MQMKTLTLICLSTILVGCAGLNAEVQQFEKHAVERTFEVIDDITEDILELEIDTIKNLTESKKKRIALEKERDEALREYLSVTQEDKPK